jgi:hypothetical protein
MCFQQRDLVSLEVFTTEGRALGHSIANKPDRNTHRARSTSAVGGGWVMCFQQRDLVSLEVFTTEGRALGHFIANNQDRNTHRCSLLNR